MSNSFSKGNAFGKGILLLSFLAIAEYSFTQNTNETPATPVTPHSEKKWYDHISLRGYTQIRYNRLLETNDKLKCEQCDRSIGENGGFFMRRMRVILFGQISSKVYFYIQPDFASSASSTGLHFAQIRDAYFDVGVDKKNEFRFRIGQSKVPFGFENMQSSQNRLPLDRNDALNSAVANERDMGLMFYYAPENKRKLFSALVKEGLKGSGDYGMVAIGLYNGQTANKPEGNNDPHLVARFTYPFEFKNQIIEAGIQGYKGKWTMASDIISSGVKINTDKSYTDDRFAASFILYPKPFGIQAEYNIGKGPEFNPSTDSIEIQNLKGGYIILSYLLKTNGKVFIPFTRYQYYDGGKKHELDARSYTVKELETGIEYQINKNFELVVSYVNADRRFEDFRNQNNRQKGNFLRIQAQLNF